MISNVSPRRDITAVDKNLRGMRLVSIYHYPIDDWYLGRVLGMRLRLKNRRINKNRYARDLRSVRTDHVDSSCLEAYRFLPR